MSKYALTKKHGDLAIEVYKSRSHDPKQRYRWRAVSVGNGKKVANGGEGYVEIADAADMAMFVVPNAVEIRYPDGYKPKKAGQRATLPK